MTYTKTWRSNGKLLLTGEYLVMRGAKALAIPLNKGQEIKVSTLANSNHPVLSWSAYHINGLWFHAQYSLPELILFQTTDEALAHNLQELLMACRGLSADFLNGSQSFKVKTQLEFDHEFGFGSSSTLVSNLAQWAKLDPFLLQKTALGGSGYDIACARSSKPLLYQLVNQRPIVEKVKLSFPFKDHLYFVYLGHKQSTQESIKDFKQKAVYGSSELKRISEISEALIGIKELSVFEKLLEEHENIISSVLGVSQIKKRLFHDYTGAVKSLGAWGGDFILMTRNIPERDFKAYLTSNGFNTIFSWDDLTVT